VNATEHPLWPLIREINASTGPGPLPFPGFLTWPGKPASDCPRSIQAQAAINAFNLLLAMEGEECTDADKWQELFQFVTATPFGLTVGQAARSAHRSDSFMPAFRESLRLPEFPKAVCLWLDCPHAKGITKAATIESLILAQGDDETERILLSSHVAEVGDQLTAFRAYHAALSKKAKNAQKAKERGADTAGLTLTQILFRWWIPAALWCRSIRGVIDAMGLKEDENSVKNCWKNLHLTKSRRPEHEARIDKAAANFKAVQGG